MLAATHIYLLDTVALVRDLPELGLKAGELGAVVDVFPGEAFAVEFVDGSGRTYGLHTLQADQLLALHTRPIKPTTEPGPDRTQFQVDRLAFFSDAVFAIAITLLALNIHPPAFVGGQPSERELTAAIGYMVPRIVGFVLSFLVIGTYWRAHHRLFRWMRGYTPRLVTLNSFLLLAVSFIPAPTGFYSDYPDHRTPLIFYAGSLAVVGLMNHLLWRYLTRHPELLDPATPPLEMRLGAGRSLVIPSACVLAIALSFVDFWLARLALLSIPLWMRVYTRLAGRVDRARRG